jgi:hypothetical protein
MLGKSLLPVKEKNLNTQIVGSNETVGSTASHRSILRKILLICGILYFPLYFTSHMLAGMQLEGYSHIDQQVSELSAVGSPARPLLDVFGIACNLLVIAFSMGVWGSAGEKRALRGAGVMLMLFGVIGFSWWFAPMTPRGAERTAADIAHIVIAYMTVLLMMLFIGFGSGADGRWFRIYSILTIVATLAAGVWVATFVPAIEQGLPTPWSGVIERVAVYSPMVWMMALAIILLRTKGESIQDGLDARTD